jgi:hypothetical protein
MDKLFRFRLTLENPHFPERKMGCAETAAQHSAVQAGRRPSRERRVAALTARGGRCGTGQGVALSVSLCGPGRARTQSVTLFSSERSIRREILTRRSRSERAGDQSSSQATLSARIARLCLSVQAGDEQRGCYRRAWSSKLHARAEIVERLGQRVLPVFFSIGHRGGAKAFTPSGAAFEISRPPPPSQAPGPISQKSLSWHGIRPPLGSSCTPRPSGQYVPTGQKPI